MRPHGKAKHQWQDNILIVEYSGSYNREGLDEARKTTLEFVNAANYSSWYRISVYADDVFGSPEVIKQANIYEAQDAQTGCLGIVYVLGSTFQRNIRKSAGELAFKRHKFVDTLEKALIEIEKMKACENVKD